MLGMTSKSRRIQDPVTYASQRKVLTDNDLLTEILIRLPVFCIHLFTTVSKQWFEILTTPKFKKPRSDLTWVDPPVGLFVSHVTSMFLSHFVSLDARFPSKKSALGADFTMGSVDGPIYVMILQSCNGLLLCRSSGKRYCNYIYNPTTNQYKKVPHSHCSLDNSPYYTSVGLRIVFDPTKSAHYKLVDAGRTYSEIDIQIYSSETGKWSLCSERFNYFNFDHFDSSIYWNDGLHWIETHSKQVMHYSLNLEDPKHPVFTTKLIPRRGMTFRMRYGYMDPMQLLIQMSHSLHLEHKLFDSQGSLLLVCLDDFGSREFTIYQLMIGCSVWTVRYRCNTDNFMSPLPDGWSIRSNVWRIVLGEKEEDSFVVISLYGKIVKYNILAKTLHQIYDCGTNQLHDDDDDEDDDDDTFDQLHPANYVFDFIPSFTTV